MKTLDKSHTLVCGMPLLPRSSTDTTIIITDFCPIFNGCTPETTVATEFKVGDRVSWNSEAGRVSRVVQKRIVSPTEFKGFTVHASREEPQYLIKSEKSDHLALG